MRVSQPYVPSEIDLADAESIRAVVLACANADPSRRSKSHPSGRAGASHRTVRAAIDWFWDKPRGVRQGHRNYSPHALWSPAARELSLGGSRDVVSDHVMPSKMQVIELREMVASAGSVSSQQIAEFLHATAWAIITKEEDAALTSAKLRSSMPEGWKPGDSPWARYEATFSQFRPEDFMRWADWGSVKF